MASNTMNAFPDFMINSHGVDVVSDMSPDVLGNPFAPRPYCSSLSSSHHAQSEPILDHFQHPNHNGQDSFASKLPPQNAKANPMMRFLNQQDPWNPARLNPSPVSPAKSASVPKPSWARIGFEPRRSAKSDTASALHDHPSSDSAYCTGTGPRSITSVEPSSTNKECPDVVQSFGHLGTVDARPTAHTRRRSRNSRHSQRSTTSQAKREQNAHICPYIPCRVSFRLPSELK